DLNQRPPGYEPDELPTALSRDIYALSQRLISILRYFRKINTFLKKSEIFYYYAYICCISFLQMERVNGKIKV
ncbi:MAG: hypothetical protein J1E34_09635, partial [Oscillospiraceae bacterium]|nr:hypothetical protein [Oscillospiraceae bacterium]